MSIPGMKCASNFKMTYLFDYDFILPCTFI